MKYVISALRLLLLQRRQITLSFQIFFLGRVPNALRAGGERASTLRRREPEGLH